jgi:hypothetical protein
MSIVRWMAAAAGVASLTACGALATSGPGPMSIEFGQDRYLTDAYLATTPGSRCGHPTYAPGGVEARAPLPDGSWFHVFAIGESPGELQTVVLERGVGQGPAQLTMRLDGQEGIVRLEDTDRRDAWGIHHPWADWLRGLGQRVYDLDCASIE